MNTSSRSKRSLISVIVLALVSVLAIAGAADAKKKKSKPPKPVSLISKQSVPIPAGTASTDSGPPDFNQVTPQVDGKAQSTITVPKNKNFPIKSVEVGVIIAPSSPSAFTIGTSLVLTGPSGASTFLNTPFRIPASLIGGNDPGSPAGVGYGVGGNCKSSAMKFTTNSSRQPASENPNPTFDDPGFADFTSFPPYTAPVSDNLNAVFKGLNSKGTWKLTAFNPNTAATDTSTLVCWSLGIKPQKLPKGQSA